MPIQSHNRNNVFTWFRWTSLINDISSIFDRYRVDNLLLVNHAMDAERYLADEILTS